jgi:cytochrome c biogenesis protein CcmG/thiol:disulfide interchange protein DsbE
LKRVLLAVLPLVLLVGLVAVFAMNMDRDPSLVRSVLINKPAPVTNLPAVEGLDRNGITPSLLEGQVTVVNVFASWCIPCRDEHPVLMELLRRTGVRLIGINQKDAPENARAFLAELPTMRWAPTGMDGSRSIGAFMACPRRSSSMRRASSPTSTLGR